MTAGSSSSTDGEDVGALAVADDDAVAAETVPTDGATAVSPDAVAFIAAVARRDLIFLA